MAVNVLVKFPDYLQEFEEIESLAAWQQITIDTMRSQFTAVVYGLKSVAGLGKWNDMIGMPLLIDESETVKKLHRLHPVVRIDELKEYISCWNRYKFNLDYNAETLTVKITTEAKESSLAPYVKRIRDIIPCNMNLEIEYDKELS